MFHVLWEVTEASQEDVLMGYMCMLCVAYIKAGILFALEEHSFVNIVLNSLFI